MKILFGVSDTIECRKAIPSIIKLFSNNDATELTLLHVVSHSAILAESGIIDCINVDKSEESNKILDEFEKAFEGKIKCRKMLKNGNPIDIVLEIAPDFDLLAIGATESSMLMRIFTSHQNSFVDSSPIPVLVAK